MNKLSKLPNKETIIIDGMNLFHRVYHGNFSGLTASNGYPTGAVFGFFHSLLHLVNIAESNRFIICWESDKRNWKKSKDDNYKANRKKDWSEDEISAFRICLRDVKYMADIIGILQITVPNFEADDIIFYLADQLKENLIIVSNDKDMLQLINDDRNVVCYRPIIKNKGKNETVKIKGGYLIADKAGCIETFHRLLPKQVPYFLALAGDSSDNVKGIKGVGEKKALSILKEYKIINTDNFKKAIPKRNEQKQFLDSLMLVKSSSIIKRFDGFNINNFSGAEPFNCDAVEEMLNDFGIKKYNSHELKRLSNYSFKRKILNKLLEIYHE